MDFAIIGAGRLGRRLALQLLGSGARCSCVRLRACANESLPSILGQVAGTWEQPEVTDWPRTILVTVQDSELAGVAEQIVKAGPVTERFVLHTSGLHTSEALEVCASAGAQTASWHPLQSFPSDPKIDVRWNGIPCAIEGAPRAVAHGFKLARRLQMVPWSINSDQKALYHAAAALAGNLPNILIHAARSLMHECGLPDTKDEASALGPLVRTCLEGALRSDTAANLTGPIARGDHETIKRHLEALPNDLSRCYEALCNYFEENTSTSWHD